MRSRVILLLHTRVCSSFESFRIPPYTHDVVGVSMLTKAKLVVHDGPVPGVKFTWEARIHVLIVLHLHPLNRTTDSS